MSLRSILRRVPRWTAGWTLLAAAVLAGAGMAGCTGHHAVTPPVERRSVDGLSSAAPTALPSALPTPLTSGPPAVPPPTAGPGGPGRATPPPLGGSGIAGVTVATPKCPVVVNESSCSPQPLAASFRLVSVASGSILTVRSGQDGRFQVAVPPGTYLLRTGEEIGGAAGQLPPVTVADGRYTAVTVPVSTGVR